MIPSTSSQLRPTRRDTAAMLASLSQSITRHSNNAVNPEPGSAHGTAICRTPCFSHFTARHVRDQNRPVLARVQMTPATLATVVPRRGAPAARTRRPPSPLARVRHIHPNLARLQLQFHVRHTPRRRHAENPSIQVFVTHPTAYQAAASPRPSGPIRLRHPIPPSTPTSRSHLHPAKPPHTRTPTHHCWIQSRAPSSFSLNPHRFPKTPVFSDLNRKGLPGSRHVVS